MGLKYFHPEADPLMKTIDDDTMALLDQARALAGIPFVITSGGRTKAENAKLKDAVPDSAHLIDPKTGTCCAVDLDCQDSHTLWRMIGGLMDRGAAKRIGIYVKRDPEAPGRLIPHHVHVDTDDTKAQEVIFLEEER